MLSLTPDMLAGAYEYLRVCPPFRRWKLPPADEVAFVVGRRADLSGWHECDGTEHRIMISDRAVGHTLNLMAVMAHEMIHLRQAELGVKAVHNAEFRKWANIACQHHGFDPKQFL